MLLPFGLQVIVHLFMIRRLGHFKRDIVTALVGAGFEAEASGVRQKGSFQAGLGHFQRFLTKNRLFSEILVRLIFA